MLDEPAERPLEDVVSRGRAGESQPGQPLEVGEARDIDIRVGCSESRRRPHVRAERLDRVAEPGVAAVELRAGVPHVERALRPSQRSVERRESIFAEAEDVAVEGAGEIAPAALEQRERPVEVAVAGQLPGLALEKNLAHTREADARLDAQRL